jgi:hypothetical protein
VCSGASILLALAALVLFEIPGDDGWAWALHILSVLSLILSIFPWRLRAAMAKSGVQKVAVIAVALLLVAAVMRELTAPGGGVPLAYEVMLGRP